MMTDKMICPRCGADFNRQGNTQWRCTGCGFTVKLLDGKPVFTDFPQDLNPSEKIERSAEQGTVWRRFNWKFIEKIAGSMPEGSDVLDVGAGRADFKALFARHHYLGIDIYPYPEIDAAVDLISMNPFRAASFDLVVLANVIEHVYEYRALISRCVEVLKPGGALLITVPFLLKLHQEPVDFHRYTRYALQTLAAENHLTVEILDAYHNPLFILDEGIGTAWERVKSLRGLPKVFGKAGVYVMQKISNGLKGSLGNGSINPADRVGDPYVLGYQCLFRKPGGTRE